MCYFRNSLALVFVFLYTLYINDNDTFSAVQFV